MNLLEYVQSLGSDISLEEKIALTKDWKKKNEPVETIVEEVKPNKFNEDGSLNVDSFSEETKGSAEKVNEKKKTAAVQDNATAFPVMSESISFGNGQSKSLFQESDWLKSYKKQQKQKEAFETQQAKLNSIVSENEMYTANGYDLKWGVSKKGNIEYYQKEEGAKDWKLEKNDTAIFDIAGALGHLDEEQNKKLKEFKKRKREAEKRRIKAIERQNQLNNNTLVPSTIPLDQPIKEGDDPNIWKMDSKGELVKEKNPYVGPYAPGYKPVPLEIQIEKYDEIITTDFNFNDKGEPIIYTKEEAVLYNNLLKNRNELVKDYTFAKKIKEGPTNQEIAEMNNLRDTDGKLKK